MSTRETTRSLPFVDRFSEEERRTLEEAVSRQEERQQKAVDARRRAATELAGAARTRMRDAVGADNWGPLRELMRRELVTFRDLRQPPSGLTMPFARADEARKAAAESFLRDRKVDIARLAAVGKQFDDDLRKVLVPSDGTIVPGHYLPANLDAWLDLSPLHQVPLPWGPLADDGSNDPHRWFLFQPPFFGFDFTFLPVHNDNFRVDRQHFLDPSVGLVGVEATMDDGDAGDFDYASVDVSSQIAFGFVPPVTGVVEVLIDAQSTLGTHDLRTEDEWGWSNSSTGQSNFLMLKVLHPNVVEPSYAEMSRFELSTDDDTTRHQENLTRGQHYFAQLFSAGPVPAGQQVVIEAGTRSFDLSGTNDVEIHSASNFQWFISSVEVRIAP
jgi:hypothetical protein